MQENQLLVKRNVLLHASSFKLVTLSKLFLFTQIMDVQNMKSLIFIMIYSEVVSTYC